MKNTPANSNTEKNGGDIRTVAVLWNENITNPLWAGILEQLGYQTILVEDDLETDHLGTVSVEIILFDAPSWSSSLEQSLNHLKSQTCSPVLCMIDTNNPESISDRALQVCDDFILKPFSPEELSLRIHWILKRHHRKTPEEKNFPPFESIQFDSAKPDEIHKHPYFTIDEAARLVRIKGKRVHLTPKEYKLFCLFASSVGNIFSNQEIIAEIWPSAESATDNDVQQYIYSLRKKIEQDASNPCFLINVPGFGYKLEEKKP